MKIKQKTMELTDACDMCAQTMANDRQRFQTKPSFVRHKINEFGYMSCNILNAATSSQIIIYVWTFLPIDRNKIHFMLA